MDIGFQAHQAALSTAGGNSVVYWLRDLVEDDCDEGEPDAVAADEAHLRRQAQRSGGKGKDG